MVQKVVQSLSNSAALDLIAKIAVVCLMPWCVWATQSIHQVQLELTAFVSKGGRFSDADAKALEIEIRREMHDQEIRIMRILQEFESEFTREFLRKDELNSIK